MRKLIDVRDGQEYKIRQLIISNDNVAYYITDKYAATSNCHEAVVLQADRPPEVLEVFTKELISEIGIKKINSNPHELPAPLGFTWKQTNLEKRLNEAIDIMLEDFLDLSPEKLQKVREKLHLAKIKILEETDKEDL